VFLVAALCLSAAWAQSTNSQSSSGATDKSQTAAAPTKTSTSKPSAPTDAEIAAAKAQHRVWVNLDSKIYHKGGRWYGKTKNGKFMTEEEAKAAGYRPSHSN
jgi:hypothetical protein